jgi:hypothetical protein
MRVLMWEAKGAAQGLVDWWRARVEPTLPEGVEAELFRSSDRLVALVRGPEGFRVPDPPERLIARPPHAWVFETVDPG